MRLAVVVWLVAGQGSGGPQGDDLDSLMQALSVSGREEAAADAVLQRLDGLGERDRLGNVVVTLGEGEPRRLLACGLDEHGLVVSEIRDDGYLRLRTAGRGPRNPLWVQGFEGQKVWISTARGPVAGAVAIPSIHLIQDAPPDDEIFGLSVAFVDVGAESAEEVDEQGIRMLDPVGLQHRLHRYGEGWLAGPGAQSKAACAALLAATRGLASGSVGGTLVIAFLRLELWNRKGIEHVVGAEGPFDEVLVASRGFGWSRGDEGVTASKLPEPGSGPLAAGEVLLPEATTGVEHLGPGEAWYTRGPDWESARHGFFALPARYRDTPVETVSTADLRALATALVAWAGEGTPASSDAGAAPEAIAPPSVEHAAAAELLSELINAYGVSTREEAIREVVEQRLPAWAEPVVDARGNLLLSFGEGDEHVAFVAHLDEVGFTVEEILEDGRLKLAIQGGLSPSAWEGQPALVHATGGGSVPGVFEPRAGWLEAEARHPPDALTVSVGTASKAETEVAGIEIGDAVTMPKRMRRLGRHRAVARSFDDRVGSTAQLLALRRIDPEAVSRRYTFAWVVEEEIGLFGSVALAAELEGLDRVHPVDTFVSSDDPYPAKGFALAPLGRGVVLRAMDNGYLADRDAIDYVQAVAAAHGIPTRVGFTGGGNDGIAFLHLGATNLPLSWPGRYSHSPVEVMDLRDLEALVELIVALVED